MKVLVTGATGLVGNNVVRLLLERGIPVRVVTRGSSASQPLSDLAVEQFPGDVRDEPAIRRAMDGVTHVVHSAAVIHLGWRGLESQREVNVEGTRIVASAAREAGARLVHVSSVDALGIGTPTQPADEETPRTGKVGSTYVVTKREAEEVVQSQIAQGLQGVIVNPGFMLGPWDWKPSSGRMLQGVAGGFALLAPSGGCSACDVRDVAAGILAALRQGHTGRNYILAGHNISYLDLWQLFARVAGVRAPRARLGPLLQFAVGRGGDLVARLTGRESDVNSAALAMSSQFHYYRSERAARELGYATRPLEETVRDAWEWLRDRPR